MAEFEIGGTVVLPGERKLIALPVSKLSNHTPMTLPVQVLRGDRPGPKLAITAAIHGDEINGVEIIRRLLRLLSPANLNGTLMCVPVVNAYGFLVRSRYLPDRRDLNQSYPGSANGSFAARLAHLLLHEVVARADVGIDLHTAAVHRENLPQIRSEFTDSPRCRQLAQACGAKVILESPERSGSLRRAAGELGVDVLVYEGGEGLRYDEAAIEAGVAGTTGAMRALRMIELADGDGLHQEPPRRVPLFATASKWVRAPEGGVLRTTRKVGDAVSEGEVIGQIANPYEDADTPVRAPRRGIIIGRTTLPIVNMGDALFHIAWSNEMQAGPSKADASAEPVLDEDEII